MQVAQRSIVETTVQDKRYCLLLTKQPAVSLKFKLDNFYCFLDYTVAVSNNITSRHRGKA